MDKTIDKKEIRKATRKRALVWGGAAVAGIAALSLVLMNMAPTVNSRDRARGSGV